MNITRNTILSFFLLILVSALYRIIPGRPFGFAPQYAMAIFGGAVFIKDKKWAFTLPVVSMFISDALYEILYHTGITTIQGFYSGQWLNYILFALLTTIGFLIKKKNVLSVFAASLAAPTAFFIVSNFFVWLGGGGLERPKTLQGLFQCYNDGLPFYPNSVYATILFSGFLFGVYNLLNTAYKTQYSTERITR